MTTLIFQAHKFGFHYCLFSNLFYSIAKEAGKRETKKKHELQHTIITRCTVYKWILFTHSVLKPFHTYCTLAELSATLKADLIRSHLVCPQYVLQLQNFHQGNLGRFFLADIPGRIGVIFGSIFYCNSTTYFSESQALYTVTNFQFLEQSIFKKWKLLDIGILNYNRIVKKKI